MKRTILPLLTIAIAACGGPAPEHAEDAVKPPAARLQLPQEAIDSAAMPVKAPRIPTTLRDAQPPYSYGLWWSSPNDLAQSLFPAARGYDSFCTLTTFSASGANSSATWSNGIPKTGPTWNLSYLGSTNPVPMLTVGGPAGSVIGSSKCFRFTDFENIWTWPGQSGYLGYSKWDWNGQGPYQGDVELWDGNSICYLSSIRDMSHSSEEAFVYKQTGNYGGGFRWRLRVNGTGGVAGGANCIYLGRSYETWGIQTAYTNQPVDLGVNQNNAVCMLTGVWGDTGNGGVSIYQQTTNGNYILSVSGGIWAAQAQCVSLWDPNG